MAWLARLSLLQGPIFFLTCSPISSPAKSGNSENIKTLVALLQNVKTARTAEERKRANEALAKQFLSISNSPDLVMDSGHYFGKDLTPQELEDLIELLKTF
ncbi:MAG: hypothetical protein QOJ45_1451 [Verrucomicrobiota bacterium]|jgi:hypothetical protein